MLQIQPAPLAAVDLEQAEIESHEQGLAEAAVDDSQDTATSSQITPSSSKQRTPATTIAPGITPELSACITKSQELLQSLVAKTSYPASHSKREGFANYVYKALLLMSPKSYSKLKPIFFKYIDAHLADSDDPDVGAAVARDSVATDDVVQLDDDDDLCLPQPQPTRHKAQWQPPPQVWHSNPPPSSVHGSMSREYMVNYYNTYQPGVHSLPHQQYQSHYPVDQQTRTTASATVTRVASTPLQRSSPRGSPKKTSPSPRLPRLQSSPRRRSPRRPSPRDPSPLSLSQPDTPTVSQLLNSARESLGELPNLGSLSSLLGSPENDQGKAPAEQTLHTPVMDVDERGGDEPTQ